MKDMRITLQVGIDPASMTDAAAIVGTLHYKPTTSTNVDTPSPRTVLALEIPPSRDPEKTLQVLLEKCSKIEGMKATIGFNRIVFLVDGTGIGNEQYARMRGKLPNLKKINIHGNSRDGLIRKKDDSNTFSWSKHDMILTMRQMRYVCKIAENGACKTLVNQIESYQTWEIPDKNGQLAGAGKPDDLLMAWLLSLARIPSSGTTYRPNGAQVLIPR